MIFQTYRAQNLMPIHHTGVLNHGDGKPYSYIWTPKHRDDANITITCILETLNAILRVNTSRF